MNIHKIVVAAGFVLYLTNLVFAESTTSQIVKKYSPSVVTIIALNENDQPRSIGSGFFINSEGDIATNHHVLMGSDKAIIKTIDGKKGEILEIINDDPELDLLIAKTSIKNTTPVSLGNSDTIKIGQEIIAIGSPVGLEGTVSNGIISGIRNMGDFKFLQITASISQGNSGGPVFDSSGKVIGIATAHLNFGQNLNFAMPVNLLKSLKPCKIAISSLPRIAKEKSSVFIDNIEDNGGMNLYRNDEYNFRIKFPIGWKTKNGDRKRVIKKAIDTKNLSSIIISAIKLPDANVDIKDFSEKELDEFLDDSIEEIKREYSDTKIIEKGIRYLNNKKAIYFKYSLSYKTLNETIDLITVQYTTIYKGKYYSIGGGSLVEKFSSQEGIINKSIATFAFEEDTPNVENLFENNLEVYRDETYKFIFQYPKTWAIVPTTHKGTIIKVVNENGLGDCDCIVNVHYIPEMKGISPKDAFAQISDLKSLQKSLTSAIPDATIIESGKTYLSNQDAFYIIVKYTFRSLGIETPMKMLQVQTVKNGYIYAVGCRTMPDRFDVLLPSFQMILAGFVIKD